MIHNLNVIHIAITPFEADAPLIVDPNAVLPFAFTLQQFQMIARRNAQIVQDRGPVQLFQFAKGRPLDIDPTSDAVAFEEGLSVFALEAPDWHQRLY